MVKGHTEVREVMRSDGLESDPNSIDFIQFIKISPDLIVIHLNSDTVFIPKEETLTFYIHKAQRFDGAHSILSHTRVCARVILAHPLNHQLTVAIHMVKLS